MEPTTKDPAFEFSDRPVTGQHFQPSRTAAEVEALLSTLKEAPGRWVVYSRHLTRGSARQRVLALRRSATYKDQPLLWRTARDIPGDPTSKVQVLVSWNPEAPNTP